MGDYKANLTIDPTDKYEKAKKDFIKAAESLRELSPQQCQQLVHELFGYEAIVQICRFMQQNF